MRVERFCEVRIMAKKNWMGFTTLEGLLKAMTLDDEKWLQHRILKNKKK